MKSPYPTSPDALTTEWFNSVLKGTPALEQGEVTSLSWTPIGTGQVGDSVRITLAHGEATSTLAAKFPAADQASRGTAAMMGLYEKEVRFYDEIAPHLSVRAPITYFAEANAEGTEFLLVFEDLGPARGGDQIAGCDVEDARAAIRQAAAIHAPSWKNDALLTKDWITPREAVTAQIRALYPQAHAVFRDRYADILEPEYMALAERVAASDKLFAPADEPLQCVVHGDFRLDNMLFDIKGGAEPIGVLDWQTVTVGKAMTDIGYFLGTGIGDELRRAHEDELLDLYLAEMTVRGVTLSRGEIWDEYRVGALSGLSTAVFSAAFVERTERGDANFLSMMRGACALALEHDSLGALEAK
ncbi:MAG: phosphotransferase [Erythrobacter sp.]|nr:phosphotransferase [Erythrobacter sp.]